MHDIKISSDDLADPMIDDVINLQKSLQPTIGEHIDDIKTPFYLNPIFYYCLASLLGAAGVWALTEPFYNDTDEGLPFISDYLLFGPVAGAMGLSMGVVYGIANHNLKQMVHCGAIGVGVGLGATLITTFVADVAFGISSGIAVAMMPGDGSYLPSDAMPLNPDAYPLSGIPFFIFMCGRGIAWSIVSIGAGLGLGIALKSKKLMLNGFVGGMIGGLLGGLFFDPIDRFLTSGVEAAVSRGVGVAAVGLLVGLFIGLFENISKDAWFLMLKGPLTGKQFNIFKSPMLIGSSPKSDIYLFKDPAIAPHHASVVKTGKKYLLRDEGSEHGIAVNGRAADRTILQPSDTVQIGDAVLRYSERSKN